MTAYDEALLGEEEWARRHLYEAFDDGVFEALHPAARDHWSTAKVLAFSGDSESAEAVLQDWRTVVPDRFRSGAAAHHFERVALYTRVVAGDTAGAMDALERLSQDQGCTDACWVFDRGWLYTVIGDNAGAVAMYERVREGGLVSSELSINDNTRGPSSAEFLHALLRLGPLYEQIGDTARAIEAYQRMVEQWADGDARGQQRVREMEARITALGG